MTLVRRIAEALARRSDRREASRAACAALFGLTAAWATQGPFGSSVLAKRCEAISRFSRCLPPDGRWCTDIAVAEAASYCDGAQCAGGCQILPDPYDQEVETGCWCTALSGRRKRRRHYYKCCDCTCPGPAGDPLKCACRQRIDV